MALRLQSLIQFLTNRDDADEATSATPTRKSTVRADPVQIAPNDPILAVFQDANGVVDLDSLELESPAFEAMRHAGIKLAVPLVSQGELIGVINLGPRLSEQEYSSDDRRLLNNLATQAAPAVRVAQLARRQQIEARERERIEQELRVARVIQQTLLPRSTPTLEGWQIAAYYQPARAVGGDFYDFYQFEDGRVGLVIGDVTDKGVPAALVMATTRAILRGAANRGLSPGEILERTNDLLFPDIPPKMFVTCFCTILDPATGRLQYANAGHDVPYRRTHGEAKELRARGMPLGLMPGMQYEEFEVLLALGEMVLFYSDGLVEAHNKDGAMYGFPRVRQFLADHQGQDDDLIPMVINDLKTFTGADWEQEDDVTLVTLSRTMPAYMEYEATMDNETPDQWQMRTAFQLRSEEGNERIAMSKVADALVDVGISGGTMERVKTAVAEATMNAIEHGNEFQADLPVEIEVLESSDAILIRITDQGTYSPDIASEDPDLDAKLAGKQSPRGWGLFLIQNMADEMRLTGNDTHNTIELLFYREGDYQ